MSKIIASLFAELKADLTQLLVHRAVLKAAHLLKHLKRIVSMGGIDDEHVLQKRDERLRIGRTGGNGR